MKKSLKYIAVIFAVGIALIIFSRMNQCGKPVLPDTIKGVTYTPKDTNFVPVEHKIYQPPSIPLLSKKSSGVKLPEGLKEKDIESVTTITLDSSRALEGALTLDIIRTKAGETFLRRDSAIHSIRVVTFEPPVFSFCLKIGVGITAGVRDEAIRFSPGGSVSFAEWNVTGLKILAPMITADLHGIGAGAQLKLYHDLYIGAIREWGFDSGNNGFRATINFVF